MSIAPDPASEHPVGIAVPRSVIFPLILLAIQGLLWGVIATVGIVALGINARSIISGHGAPPHGVAAFAIDATFLAVATGMAALSAITAIRLSSRRSRAWLAATGLEILMTCFGVFLAVRGAESNAPAAVIAGGAGAILSSVAIACLVSRSARQSTRRAPLPAATL